MNPVTRALQTIAAIERETHERIHAEAASTCPTESLSHPLSTRSQAFADGRNGPTPRSANSKATADLNGGSGAPSIDQADTTSLESAFARKREIRIDKRARSRRHTTSHYNYRRRVVICAGPLPRMDWRTELRFCHHQTSVAPRQESRRGSTGSCKIGPTGNARFIGEDQHRSNH